MKTLTTLTLATVLTVGFAMPVHANSITDTITEAVSAQLTELSINIKQQAKIALENTAAELFFSAGSAQAEQAIATVATTQSQNTSSEDK